MKTLVVLSALAAVAIAAPALLHEAPEQTKALATFTDSVNREKKSPTQDSTSVSDTDFVAPVNLPTPSQMSEFGVSGRSFGLKKPIIIKKKQGYPAYRDSDGEQAESEENCSGKVKVKLCDTKAEDIIRSSTTDDANLLTKEEMKQSITLAKEAIDNIQRDFKKKEHKSHTNPTAWKHGHSASDEKLHQDIEVAREALENIKNNFGNLESLSLHAAALNEAEGTKDSKTSKAETERLAQWKQAMEEIHKNVEIARNIEDSFKESPFNEEAGENNKAQLDKISGVVAREADKSTKTENKFDCKDNHVHVKSNEKDETKKLHTEDDMASAASTTSDVKIENLQNPHEKKHATETTSHTNNDESLKQDKQQVSSHKEKHADEQASTGDMVSKQNIHSDLMKTKIENKERKALEDNKESDLNLSNTKIKSAESGLESQNQKLFNHNDMKKSPEKHKFEMKTTEQTDKHDDMKKSDTQKESLTKETDTSLFVKSAELNKGMTSKQSHDNLKTHQMMSHNDNLAHHFTETKMAHDDALRQNAEHLIVHSPNAEHTPFHLQTTFLHPEMRMRDNEINQMHHHHQLVDPSQTRWAENKNLPTEAFRSGDAMQSQTMEHSEKMQVPPHHHHVIHDHHASSGHGQQFARFPDFIAQGKSADAEMQAYYMSMRDGSNLGPESHRIHWKPVHESSRSAYGIAAPSPVISAPSGAVGVFPNANIGNCAIPLLLSCNPTVVQGSLGKPPPTYSAPAYRTEDDFNFHAKRDVKKTHDNLLNSLHKTPSNLKTSSVLVGKQ